MTRSDLVATIVAGGQRYTNWTSVTVQRDYCNWLSTFEFCAAEPGPVGQGWASVRLKPGDPVQVYLGTKKVIDGSVTTRQTSIDAKRHDVVVAGKSKTQRLESSVKVQPGNFNGYTFEQAARSVLGQVGIGLSIQNPPPLASKVFKSLSVQLGETIGEFIERIAKMRGYFLTDDADGQLVAGQAKPGASPVAELQEGVNILHDICTLDNQSAWSGLSVVAQQPGSDEEWPSRDYSATGSNPNATVDKYQLMLAEHAADAQDCQQRVNFEQALAAWGDVNCVVTVVGWHKPDGSLWDPTEHVTVLAPSLFPNESAAVILGIQACVYQQDSQNGTTTTLTLKKPPALMTLPSPFDGQTQFSGPTTNPVDGSAGQAQVDQPDTH